MSLTCAVASLQSKCAPLLIVMENMQEMAKWLALAQHLNLDMECQLTFDIFMSMIVNDRFQNFAFDNAS